MKLTKRKMKALAYESLIGSINIESGDSVQFFEDFFALELTDDQAIEISYIALEIEEKLQAERDKIWMSAFGKPYPEM